MTSKTIAVTGANGFLGRNCIQTATKMNLNVRAIVRRTEAANLVKKLGAEPIIIKQLNKHALTQAFEDCDAVLHFIGIVNEENGTFEEVNVHGTKLVHESAQQSHASRFITPSGLGVDQYGKKTWATNNYFASKRQVEQICNSGTIPYVIFRPSYILGPDDELIPNLINAILKGNVQIAGKGNTPMQPIFVEDAETAFLKAATGQGKANSTYDLVGPETTTFLQFTARVAEAMRQEGFTVPTYRIEKIPLKTAPQTMGLSKEEVDVMLCDEIGDPKPFTNDLNITLTPLDKAIHAAVQAAKEEHRQ